MDRIVHRADFHFGQRGASSVVRLAAGAGWLDSLYTMVRHETFLVAVQEQRDSYLAHTVATTLVTNTETREMLIHCLIEFGGADPNGAHRSLSGSPMHYCIWFGRAEDVHTLVKYGGDVHRKLHLPGLTGPYNSTPLKAAITGRTPAHTIGALLERSPLRASSCGPGCGSCYYVNYDPMDIYGATHTNSPHVLRLSDGYCLAACIRLEPAVFRVLFGRDDPCRLDPNLQTTDGHTPLASLCIVVLGKAMVTFGRPRPTRSIAEQGAACARELIRLGADVSIPDHGGLTPLDRIRDIIMYHGDNPFLQEVATVWNVHFVLEGSTLRVVEDVVADVDGADEN